MKKNLSFLLSLVFLSNAGFCTLPDNRRAVSPNPDNQRLLSPDPSNAISVELSPNLVDEQHRAQTCCRHIARCASNSARNCYNCVLHFIVYGGIFSFGFAAIYIYILKFKQS